MKIKDSILLISLIANVMLAILFFSASSSSSHYRKEVKESRRLILESKKRTYAIMDSIADSEARFKQAMDSMRLYVERARNNENQTQIKRKYEKLYLSVDSSSFSERMRFFANELSE